MSGCFPAIEAMLVATCERLEQENAGIVKTGRTHLQDAVPITFGAGDQRLADPCSSTGGTMIGASLDGLYELALGGTAVGTGLNAPAGLWRGVPPKPPRRSPACPSVTAPNKFHALTGKDALVFSHGALEGPGGEPDEDRQRRALAGLRPPVRPG